MTKEEPVAWRYVWPDGEVSFYSKKPPAEAPVEPLYLGPPQDSKDPLRHAFRAVDDLDWQHLNLFMPHSGHGRFWRSVFAEVRAALSDTRPDREGK